MTFVIDRSAHEYMRRPDGNFAGTIAVQAPDVLENHERLGPEDQRQRLPQTVELGGADGRAQRRQRARQQFAAIAAEDQRLVAERARPPPAPLVHRLQQRRPQRRLELVDPRIGEVEELGDALFRAAESGLPGQIGPNASSTAAWTRAAWVGK